jgi:hypothetical protein
MDVIYPIIGFVVVTIILSLYSAKKHKSTWTGTLIDKTYEEDKESVSIRYRFIIKTDKGKKIKVNVDQAVFSVAHPGDRYQKIKGDSLPKRII